MNPQTTSAPCLHHRSHSPEPKQNHFHHIQPLSWNGPDTAANRTTLCPTSHANTHLILDQWRKANDEPPWEFLKHYGPAERELARLGFERWLESLATTQSR